MAKLIELVGISKSYDGETVIDNMNLYIRDKEFITFLGPSGCGKTTTLRIIGGFETADSGNLYFDGQEISDVPAHKRQVNTVFQKYALFPHLNVFENVAFPLREKKVPKDEIEKTLEIMNDSFEELLNKMFQNTAFDVTTDAQVLQSMLAREGLAKESNFATMNGEGK